MEVRVLADAEHSRWDAFVASQSDATFFHRAGWRTVLQEALGHPCHYLYAEEDGKIAGILPLGHVKSRLFGNALISTPFCVYGGIVAASDEARAALDAAACRLARELEVDCLELRNCAPGVLPRPGKDLYVTFRKRLSPDPEANFRAIPRKQRAMIRHGIAGELNAVVDGTAERFFRVYGESVRNLGTPVFPRELFVTLLRVFGKDCEILSVERNGVVLSGVMSFYFRDQVLPYYGGGTREAREYHGNDFLYWELMRRSTERGVGLFDFGRSKRGTGSFGYKCHWGFVPEPLFYEYELVRAKQVPELNPLNPKYRLFIAAWKRLPLPVSNRVGPLLSRYLG